MANSRPRSSYHVLVAAADAFSRMLVARQIEKLGYRAHAVASVAEALETFDRESFDAVLMDCDLPGDGYAAARTLRERRRGMPIIALVPGHNAAAKERCHEAGADECLPKPVPRAELAVALVRRMLGETWPAAPAEAPADATMAHAV